MKTWINVDPSMAFESQKELIAGREVNVFISPYNVPRAIRAEKSSDGKRLIFYFRYLDGEEDAASEGKRTDDGLAVIRYGKTSGRVTEVELDLTAAKARSARLRDAVEGAEKALDTCEHLEASLSRRLNYKAASEALELSRYGLAAYV